MTDESSPRPEARPPVSAPPGYPPPPPQYYPPPPAPPRPGLLGSLTKLGGLIGLAVMLFLIGFYAAVFVISGQGGPQAAMYRDGNGLDQIAIIPIVGMIDSSTVAFVHTVVEDVLDDESIKAVVLRIESPGGGATASDEILHDLLRLRTERDLPIVASYGDYAASGGYYVSAMADHIYAQPTTVTGSIGVIAPFFTVHGLLEKIGVEPQIVTSTAATDKDTASMFRPWTDADRKEVTKLLDTVQNQFVKVVADGRKNLDEEQVRSFATGSVMTAPEAMEKGLIDGIGYLDEALEHARTLAGISETDPPVIIYHWPATFIGQLLGAQASSRPPMAASGAGVLGVDAEMARTWAAELSVPRMMYLARP